MAKSKGIRPPRQFWTDAEVQLLRTHYADSLTEDLAKALGMPLDRVRRKAFQLGLEKTPEFLSSLARARTMQPGHGSERTRIQPGTKPWNAGTKGVCGVQEACRATQFKPGQKPAQTRPVGSLRVCDGYLQRKVAEASDSNSQRWRCVHELVWIEAHGPVPPGHLVVFKPGRRTATLELITLDAVELISRRDHMLRNSVHRYGPEVASIHQLRASIRRQINRKQESPSHHE